MSQIKLWIRKLIVYCVGLFVLAMGVSFSVRSDLGVSPVNSIPYVVSKITSIDFGVCITTFLSLCVLLQFFMLRKKFKPINILQVLCSSLFGMFVNLTNMIIENILPAPINYISSLIMLVISIVLVAIGVLLYLKPDIMMLPCEGIVQVLSDKTPIKFGTIKIGFDVTVVTIATILSLVFLHGLDGVREGTIIAAIGVGAVIKIVDKVIHKPLDLFLYGIH